MTSLDGGLLVLGLLAALVVPWVLVATLPYAGGGAERRGQGRRRRDGQEAPR